MKILTIRGKNLASFAGDFELHLDKAPFAGAGIFAILGPTGAGKSTLLDAVCLALFDDTPRLSTRRNNVFVGAAEEPESMRLGTSDTRSVLRRGTGEGVAEVEFLAQDGHRYRARWSVRRARGKAEGALQQQEMTVTNLDTQECTGGKKTAVLEKIEQLVGLSFEQFRRSALLAQGEFAAFLQASGAQRAELLEKMTGKEIYTRVSQCAFDRGKKEAEEWRLLEAKAGGTRPLDDEGRAALLADIVAARSRLVAAKARVDALRQAQAWFKTDAELRAAEAAAAGELADALGKLRAMDAVADELDRVKAVQPLRATLVLADGAAQAREKAVAAVSTAEAAAKSALAAIQVRGDERTQAQEKLDAAVKQQQERQPELVAAGRLDADIEAVKGQAMESADVEARRHKEWTEASTEAAAIRQELDRCESEASALTAELAARSKFDALARQWPRWKPLLAKVHQLSKAQASMDVDGLLESAKSADSERIAAEVKFNSAASLLDAARAEVAKVEAASAEVDLDQVRQERESCEAARDSLKALAVAIDEVKKAEKAHAKAAKDAQDSTEKVDELAAQATANGTRTESLARKLEAAELELGRLQSILDLDGHRANLVDGEACALCGSKEHPYVQRKPRVDDKLAKAMEAAAALRKESAAAARQDATCAEKLDRARQDATEAASTLKDAAAELRAAAKAHKDQHKACADKSLPSEPSDDARKDVLARVKDLEKRREAAAAKEKQQSGAAKAAKAARTQADARQADVETARKKHDLAVKRAEAARRVHEDAVAKRDAAAREQVALVEEVSPAFDSIPKWRERLAADAGKFRDGCDEEVARHDALRANLAAVVSRLEPVRASLGAASARLEERTQALKGAEATARAHREVLDARAAERRKLLKGASVVDVTTALQKAVAASRTRLDEAMRELNAVEKAEVAARTELESALARAGEARQGATAAAKALEESLQGRAINEVRALLARDEKWVTAQGAALEQARRALDKAQAVHGERQAKAAQHSGSGRPGEEPGSIPTLLSEAQAARDAEESARATMEAHLVNDDTARAESAQMAAQVLAQRNVADLWKEMSDLIGSSDGKKFRVFAQALTFGALLEESNHHLKGLTQRYTLAPAAVGDLEFQVIDHDMADEVRSPSTLSGGESFLVSLALALGLSSLDASRTRVETLFIDEGFGSLDGATLDTALASLEALQAGGRQIGVISHVERLAAKVGAKVHVRKANLRSSLVVEGG